MTQYPKRIIEVDLPIKRTSTHARRGKSIRHPLNPLRPGWNEYIPTWPWPMPR